MNYKYQAATVEDLEYALRITQDKKRIIYSNLFQISHQHTYPSNKLTKYFNRVFLDFKQFKLMNNDVSLILNDRDKIIFSSLLILNVINKKKYENIDLSRKQSLIFLGELKSELRTLSENLLMTKLIDETKRYKELKSFLYGKKNIDESIFLEKKTTIYLSTEYFHAFENGVSEYYKYKNSLSIKNLINCIEHIWANKLASFLALFEFEFKFNKISLDDLNDNDWGK